MKLISIFVTCVLSLWLSASPGMAEVHLRISPNGLYFNGNVGGIDFNGSPKNPTIRAPFQITQNPSDQEMALQAMAMALTIGRPDGFYRWVNRRSGNMGSTTIGRRQGNCHQVHNQLNYRGGVHDEWMTVCRGGGRSNTWIANKRWIIASVDRTKPDRRGCIVRFVDPKIPGQPRAASTLRVCRHGNTWTVGE